MLYGKHTYGSINLLYQNDDAKLVIGNFCSLGQHINIYLGGNHRTDWVTTYPFGHMDTNTFNKFNGAESKKTKGDVIIGNDVWIGDCVTIMSGITIGDGAVVANNSHVVKNVEPYSMVGGNPARFIKYRFTKDQIDKLLEIKWWDWDDEKINQYTPLLCNIDIDKFISSALDHENVNSISCIQNLSDVSPTDLQVHNSGNVSNSTIINDLYQ